MNSQDKDYLVEVLKGIRGGITEPNIPNKVYIVAMQSYGLVGGESIYYAHSSDNLFIQDSKVFLITNLGLHYAAFFRKWEDVLKFTMVKNSLGVVLKNGQKQAISSSIHGVPEAFLSKVVNALNHCLESSTSIANTKDSYDVLDKSSEVMSEEPLLYIKCQECGEVYKVDTGDYCEHDICYNCDNCGGEIGVRFFGHCGFCDVNIGFTDDPSDSVIKNFAKGVLKGVLRPDKAFEGLERFVDDIPDANSYGICMNCGRRHLECPECGQAVYVPQDSDISTDIFTCPFCGTRMRHP